MFFLFCYLACYARVVIGYVIIQGVALDMPELMSDIRFLFSGMRGGCRPAATAGPGEFSPRGGKLDERNLRDGIIKDGAAAHGGRKQKIVETLRGTSWMKNIKGPERNGRNSNLITHGKVDDIRNGFPFLFAYRV